MAGTLVLHVPPAPVLDKVVTAVWQIVLVPVIAVGVVLTVNGTIDRQVATA